MRVIDSILSKRQKAADLSGAGSAGFSLVELLVAMVVASIVMAAISSVYASLTRSYTTQNVAADVQQAVRAGIDFVAEDIMLAGLDPQRTADAEIKEAGSTKIRFTADRNMDGDADDNFEEITYELIGTQLRQTDHSGTETLIDNVEDFQFIYRNAANLDLINDLGLSDPLGDADRPNIRTVEISITVGEPAGRGGTVERTYTTRVRCRNIGLL
jgi:prepilin-type N-terminal cleavage/methylation domain-containing protein